MLLAVLQIAVAAEAVVLDVVIILLLLNPHHLAAHVHLVWAGKFAILADAPQTAVQAQIAAVDRDVKQQQHNQ